MLIRFLTLESVGNYWMRFVLFTYAACLWPKTHSLEPPVYWLALPTKLLASTAQRRQSLVDYCRRAIDAVQNVFQGAQFKDGNERGFIDLPYVTSGGYSILFETFTSGATFRKPTIPVIFPVYRCVIKEAGMLRPQYFARHCRTITDRSSVVKIGPVTLIKTQGLYRHHITLSHL